MNEFELIARLKPLLPSNDYVVVGAGDDCAVLDLGEPDSHTLFKADAVVEGIHFTRDLDPARVGHKALARALSDIAAMGGTPTAAVVTVGVPSGDQAAWVEAGYRGLCRTAARHQVAVVGGETTTSPDRLFLSVALLGRVPRGQALLRSGARAGDALFVTGELGGSLAGHHLDFEPRLAEGRWLRASGRVHAMMDLSDGLAGDLRHLLAASGDPGAEIHAQSLPLRRAAREAATRGDLARPAVVAALTDGEDFELLFTVAPGDAVPVLDGFRAAFPGVRLTCIGRITPGPGLWLREPRGLRPLSTGGFIHLQ